MTAPVLGLAAAAKACNVSQSTLRRKRPELLELGAVQGAKGWQIPVPALIQLGLMERTSAPEHVAPPETPARERVEAPTTPPSETPSHELETLRRQLADAQQRAAVAEAVAAERERIIEAQALALRMLEGPREQPETAREQREPAPLSTDEKVARRRWWHFLG